MYVIKREITDLLSVTFGFHGLSLIVLFDNFKIKENILFIIGFVMVILGGYSHLIFRQLNVISDKISRIFTIGNFTGFTLLVSGYLIHDKEDYFGYWDKLPIEYNQILIVNIIIILLLSLLSVNAKLMYYNSD